MLIQTVLMIIFTTISCIAKTAQLLWIVSFQDTCVVIAYLWAATTASSMLLEKRNRDFAKTVKIQSLVIKNI